MNGDEIVNFSLQPVLDLKGKAEKFEQMAIEVINKAIKTEV